VDPYLRGRDREVRGVERDQELKVCVERALSDAHEEKNFRFLTA
jgi:hypothetical protein